MSLANLNFHHLRLFWEVARIGSLRGAAEKLHLSQPTISTQIKNLEEQLEERLFDRSGRGMKLTSAGKLILEYAGELFSLADEMVSALHHEGRARRLRLNLGITQSLPKLVSWQLIRPALAAFPDLQLTCIEGHAPELLGMLVSGRVDAILADEVAPTALRVRAFSQHLNDFPVSFCATPALAKRLKKNFPQSLNNAPALLPTEGTAWRHELDRWFESRHIIPRIIAEVKNDSVARYGLSPIASIMECSLSCYLLTVENTTRHPAITVLVDGAKKVKAKPIKTFQSA